jgi:hypothetical protein
MHNFTRLSTRIVLAIGAAGVLSACSSGLIANRERPDEFVVQRQAPLVIPPDFELVPPAPGAPRPAEGTAAQQALDALFPAQERSAVETSALDRAGDPEVGIRSTVGDQYTYTVDKGTTTRAIIAAPEGDGQAARAVICSFRFAAGHPRMRVHETSYSTLPTSNLSMRRPSMSTTSKRQPWSSKASPSVGSCLSMNRT